MFRNWFYSSFVLGVEDNLQRKNISFKVLKLSYMVSLNVYLLLFFYKPLLHQSQCENVEFILCVIRDGLSRYMTTSRNYKDSRERVIRESTVGIYNLFV